LPKNLSILIKKITLYILPFFFTGIFKAGFSQEIFTIGPMVHFNFGGEKMQVSYSIEFSYWNFSHFYYGVDGAVEFEAKRIRIYSEIQTGVGLAGLSCGPVLEINTDNKTSHVGVQGSAWANFFIGLDFRERWINKTRYTCPGVYFKVPFADSGFDDSNGSVSHHHYHHHHHH